MTTLFIIISVALILAIIGRSSIESLRIPLEINSTNSTYKNGMNRVEFKSRGKKIVGNLFIPNDYKEGEKRPAMVIAPPATSLKEHAAGFYAEKFVKYGYITLSIDTRGIGESEGIRCDVDPYHHVNDVASAVSFLDSLKQVDSTKLFNVGVCAGGVASPYETFQDKRIKAQGLITPSIAGPELMKSTALPVRIIIYIIGGIFNLLNFIGLNVKLPATPSKIPQGDSTAARGMQEISTYYLPGKVGHHMRWVNNTSATSLPGVARLHIFDFAKEFESIPVVQVVGKDAYSYEPAMRFYNMLPGTKELLELENTNHVDFYYKDEPADRAVEKIDAFFKKHLNQTPSDRKAGKEPKLRTRLLQAVGVLLALVFFLMAGIFSLGSTPKNADITKEMHDPELQSMYLPGRVIASLMSKEWGVNMFNSLTASAATGDIEGFQSEERFIKSSEGHEIRVRIFKPLNASDKLPAMLYTHGGGYLSGFPEQALDLIQDFMEKRDVVVVAPAYRLSVEHPYPAGFNDCYETLLWMKENAAELGIFEDNYILAGRSAGGGMAAALALKARDTKDVNIAFQMPLFPMIDYRQNTESAKMTGAIIWDNESNKHGWHQYLKGLEGNEVPAYASPATAEDFRGLPPTITHVGSVEPFRDETINYVEALKAAGIPTQFKIFQGAYHGFNNLSPDTEIGRAGDKFQFEAFAEYFDLYITDPSLDSAQIGTVLTEIETI